jgi:hypothetical protein
MEERIEKLTAETKREMKCQHPPWIREHLLTCRESVFETGPECDTQGL